MFQYKQWCMAMDQGKIPSEIKALLTGEEQNKSQQNSSRHTKAGKTDANSNSCKCHQWENLYLRECVCWAQCFMTVILALWEAEVGRSLEPRSSRPDRATWQNPISTKKYKNSLGIGVHACNPSYLGGWGGRITWAQGCWGCGEPWSWNPVSNGGNKKRVSQGRVSQGRVSVDHFS